MHWDRLFEDLEGQLASEWEAERAALDAESERLRVSRLELRARLRFLCAAHTSAVLTLADGQHVGGQLHDLGADWIATITGHAEGQPSAHSLRFIPLAAVHDIRLDHGMVLASLNVTESPVPKNLRERMTLGFVLRDLARRRTALRITTLNGESLYGTIDRAGVDHLDLALHDAGSARRPGAVQSFHLIPIAAVVTIETRSGHAP